VAKTLGMKDADFMTSPELIAEIQKWDNTAYEKLILYLKNYERGFEFDKWIEAEGKTKRLSEKETEEGLSLMKQ
jgi:hypothetical protein